MSVLNRLMSRLERDSLIKFNESDVIEWMIRLTASATLTTVRAIIMLMTETELIQFHHQLHYQQSISSVRQCPFGNKKKKRERAAFHEVADVLGLILRRLFFRGTFDDDS